MASSPHAVAVDEPAPERRLDAAGTLSALRMVVGVGSWVSPALSWLTFGLRSMNGDPRSALVTRLFGIRDAALGLAVQHPDPVVQRAALRIGVGVDAADVVATLLALRKGSPKATLVLIGGGAALFVGLGIAAVAAEHPRPEG